MILPPRSRFVALLAACDPRLLFDLRDLFAEFAHVLHRPRQSLLVGYRKRAIESATLIVERVDGLHDHIFLPVCVVDPALPQCLARVVHVLLEPLAAHLLQHVSDRARKRRIVVADALLDALRILPEVIQPFDHPLALRTQLIRRATVDAALSACLVLTHLLRRALDVFLQPLLLRAEVIELLGQAAHLLARVIRRLERELVLKLFELVEGATLMGHRLVDVSLAQ